MSHPLRYLVTPSLILVGLLISPVHAESALPACLPGELSAEDVLNGKYPFPPSPESSVTERRDGFAVDRLGVVPAPGIHPRVLFSPEQLPELRRRIADTTTGKALMSQLSERIAVLSKSGAWEKDFYEALIADDAAKAMAIFEANQRKPNDRPGHYQPHPLYAIVLECFAALLADDRVRGERSAKAVNGYAALLAPLVEHALNVPMGDDVFRAKIQGPTTGKWSDSQGIRDLMGNHLVGYAYDFTAMWMTEAQKSRVRQVIARSTAGRLWMGARLPHHFRNWNWCAVGLGQPLLALAIEGEEGYDARVPKLGAEIARDYLTYGISPEGASTEAVGYTQFGFVWANPFIVAMTRRGESLLTHSHFRNMLTWYAHSMEPMGTAWASHGDGGDRGPSIGTALLWKHFFPTDQLADFTLQRVLDGYGDKLAKDRDHIIEQLVLCEDPALTQGKPVEYKAGATLGLPATWFDPLRSSLISRNTWGPQAAVMQFECRTDSVGASHEHADRGAFTFTALGRPWARDYFRSVESRHHNVVQIDGKGQGYWPGPGKWLGQIDHANVTIAACDAADAYRWWWPKQITSNPVDPALSPRFAYPRWSSYQDEAKVFAAEFGAGPFERDDRPSVVAHWKDYEKLGGGPRMWDEDGWPTRLPYNPVQRAFRTVVFGKSATPWLLVVDDIQKDDQERLYEWSMMTGANTELLALTGESLELGDATMARDAEGQPKPVKTDRALKITVLRRNIPIKPHDYQAMPSIRLESYERKDSLVPEAPSSKLSGSRSFSIDKRLIIPTRAAAPDFVILLQPHLVGIPAVAATWNVERTALTIGSGADVAVVHLTKDPDGRTRIQVDQAGATTALP